MLARQYLTVNSAVELHLKIGDKNSIVSVILQDITPDGIFITRPILDAKLFPIMVGTQFDVHFSRQQKDFSFQTSVIRETKLGQTAVLLVKHPLEIKNHETISKQRFERIPISISIKFLKLQSPAGPSYGSIETGTTIDLCASGVKFTVQSFIADELSVGRSVKLSFTVSDQMIVTDMIAEVIKIESDRNIPSRIIVICRFANVYPDIQDAINLHNQKWKNLFTV